MRFASTAAADDTYEDNEASGDWLMWQEHRPPRQAVSNLFRIYLERQNKTQFRSYIGHNKSRSDSKNKYFGQPSLRNKIKTKTEYSLVGIKQRKVNR